MPGGHCGGGGGGGGAVTKVIIRIRLGYFVSILCEEEIVQRNRHLKILIQSSNLI